MRATPELDQLISEEGPESMNAFDTRERSIKRSMSAQEKVEYNLYRKACHSNGVEATFADFRDRAIDANTLQEVVENRQLRAEKKHERIAKLLTGLKAKAATAGR